MELIGFALDSQPVAQGAARINSALDGVGKRIDAMLDKAAKINSKFTEAFRLGGGGASSAGRGLDDLANKTKRLADETLRYAQAQARLQQSQGNTAGAIRTLTDATKNHEGSVRALIGAQTQLARLQTSQGFKRYASTIREAGESIQQTGYFLTSLSAGLVSVGAAAVKSAFDIDRNINVLKALLGSTDAAEERFKRLREISRVTPGLTTGFAVELDSQLRVIGVTQQAIDKLLPTIGRLNAISKIDDPRRFVQNLGQLATTNFQVRDIRELINASPIAGQVFKKTFNVDNALDGENIRKQAQKLGLTTADAFFTAFAKAAEDTQALKSISESLETRFAKLVDRVTIALRPLGLVIIKTLEPIVEKAIPIIERLSKAFENLPDSTKTAIVSIGAFAAVIGPVVVGIGAFMQAFGAIGNLASVGAALGGIKAGVAGLGIAFPVATAAVAAFALAYATDFGGIRSVTADVVRFVVEQTRAAAKSLSSDIGPAIKTLQSTIADFSESAKPLIRDFWEFFRSEAEIAIKGSLEITRQGIAGIKALLSSSFLTQIATAGTSGIGDLLKKSNGASLLKNVLTGGTSTSIEALARQFRSTEAPGAPSGSIANPASIVAELERQQKEAAQTAKIAKTTGGGSSRRAESDARQLRAAEEELAKATAKARLDIEENTIKKLIELDKDGFEKRLISADEYYANLQKRELQLQDIEKQRIQAELSASQVRLAGAKKGSPEAIREQAQEIELQSRLVILETERAETVRKLTDELLKNKTAEQERRNELLKAGAAAQLPLLKRQAEFFQAQSDAKRDAPETKLRLEEIRLQGLADAGLIREQQLTDALILTKRAFRDELIKAAEARKIQAQAEAELEGKFFDSSRYDEEIASLHNLGTELTRAEQLRKRFAEQGRIDYSRLNEGVEELLASQKGLTEIFSDFRANLVKDQFDLIDIGVDKLTKRLGVLGNALGQLLKDLAKLALSKIFQKLFGLDTGSGSSFGFGGGSARSTPSFAGLGNIITGGAGASGGGGIGSFLTGGFAGGNPAQAAIGGNGGGGGILGQVLNGGGGSSGGGGFSSLLSKIPIIGKLFGGGGNTGTPGGIPIFTQGSGSEIGTAGGASGALGGLGSFAAGGLLAGGGLLGSLVGRGSQAGQLLGGIGGTLLGGFAASALINPALLPLFFSNPITAIIGGALIGVGALLGFLKNREFNKFRKEVDKEYQLKVDNKEAGKSLYQSIKALGEEQFGKGKFGKKILDTIRLQKAQEQLAAYGESTGQENNALVKKFRDQKELTSQFDPRNQFVKRYAGGAVNAYQSYIIGEHRPEVFTPSVSGQIYPSFPDFAALAPQTIGENVGGAWTHEFRVGMQRLTAAVARFEQASSRIEGMPPEAVLVMGAKRNPDVITSVVATSFDRRTPASDTIRDRVNNR